MRIRRHLAVALFVVCLGCLSALSAHGQEVNFASDWDFDYPGSGNVFAWAETWTDYSTGYYYGVWAHVALFIQPTGGSQYEATLTCDGEEYADVDAYIECTGDQASGPADYQVVSSHSSDATYWDSQFDPGCEGEECGWYYDAYEMSLLGVSGQTYTYDVGWELAGPPAIAVPEEVTASGSIEHDFSIDCSFPTGEQSAHYDPQWKDEPSGRFGGLFTAMLQQPPGGSVDFSGRQVQEILGTGTDSCYNMFKNTTKFPGPIPNGNASTWTVGGLNIYGTDLIGVQDGDTDPNNYVLYYKNQLGAGQSCGYSLTQSVEIDTCGVTLPGVYVSVESLR